MSQGISWGK